MPKEFHRSERVSELIHRLISDIVRNELRDPRLRLVTITDLQLSRDLAVAKVYFTSMDDTADLDEIAGVLGKAAGFIRSQVGSEIRLRSAPELRFFKDEAELRGRHMSRLISDAVSKDQATHQHDDELDSGSPDADAPGQDDGQTT